MDLRTPKCPRCGIDMQEGFILDRAHNNRGGASLWVEGTPEKSFWTGIRTRGLEKRRITSYRCMRCGLLESYAVAEGK